MSILSFQSAVALGYVGNSGAAFALRRLGHEVWPVDTVSFSNHPGHGGFRGRVTPAGDMHELVRGLAERGVLGRCQAVLSGYLGAAEQGRAVIAAVAEVKAANPKALFLLDPVIGDHGRVYVRPGVPEFLRDEALPRADILTPNQFELEFLTGRKTTDTASALAAAATLRRAARLVVATGLSLSDLGTDVVAVLVVSDQGRWRIAAPLRDHPAYGAGDVFTAVLLGRLLSGNAPPNAAAHAASAVHALVARGVARGGPDLALVEGQDDLLRPPVVFRAEPLA
jgi:pyridoxine kinase